MGRNVDKSSISSHCRLGIAKSSIGSAVVSIYNNNFIKAKTMVSFRKSKSKKKAAAEVAKEEVSEKASATEPKSEEKGDDGPAKEEKPKPAPAPAPSKPPTLDDIPDLLKTMTEEKGRKVCRCYKENL